MSVWSRILAIATKAFAPDDARQDSSAETGRLRDSHDVGFTIAIVGLGAKLARADGFVSDDEVGAFMEAFKPPEGEEANVRRVFELARQTVAGFESYAKQVGRKFRDRPYVLENVLDGLFHIAAADGAVTPDELDYLERVAVLFGFGEAHFKRIRAAHLGPDTSDPYDILGVAPDADFAEIRAAWRRMALQHHPDSMTGRGTPGQFLKIAHEKMAAINAAYDKIRQERGLRRNSD